MHVLICQTEYIKWNFLCHLRILNAILENIEWVCDCYLALNEQFWAYHFENKLHFGQMITYAHFVLGQHT
jgi:hypothetical protein